MTTTPTKAENPSAFPQFDYGNAGSGMTLRDWFAGQALAGYLSGRHPDYTPSWGEAAQEAYSYADALLAQRSKTNG